ncbi:uncharacterized protein [Aquarana catesbeiana]|uniref:uncharacterized protein isoform X3 n=1 Tax=Aquarana catesbeiana TaxID=8400 RepID=UPI003CC9FFFA
MYCRNIIRLTQSMSSVRSSSFSTTNRDTGVTTLPKTQTSNIMNGRIVWLFHLLYSTGAALQMTGPSTYEARVGSIAQIPCTFTADILPADPRFFAVVWDLEGKQILKYDNIVTSTNPRYSLDIDQALNGIAHLTISNTFLSDGGIYTCSVTNSPVLREKEIKVKISGAALQMTGPSTYEARVGSIAQIPCTFTADILPADPRFFAVVWDLEGKQILKYDNIVTSTDPRYSLDIDQALNGIAHLTISNTFLSDGGIYTCSVTDSPILRVKEIKVKISGGALQMTGPSTYKARVGSIAHIPCNFTADNLPADPRYFTVFWYLEGKRILSYDKTVTSTNPRFSLDGDQALNGIADLIISNTLLSDGGIYKCSVNYSSFPMDREISMNVSARPLISILNKSVQRNTENNLTCMANGFFPNNINVTWYKDGEVLKNQLMGEPLQYDNGTYQVNSTVTITPNNDDRNKTFSCRIQHVSLQEPLQEDFQLLYEGVNNQEFQSAPSNVNDTSPTSPEQRGGQQVKDNTQLEESQELLSTNEASDRAPPNSRDTSVTSLEEIAGQQVSDNKESIEDREEKQRLLNTNKVAEENPSDASKIIKQTPTNPSWSTGKTGGKSLGSPEQHLPPKDLQVSPRSRQSFAEKPPNQREENNTTITPAKRPKENPNTPHNRQLPEIGEITVPELIAGKKATLSCRICNYIPGEHKVSWHVKEKSTGDVIAANDDRKKHESIEKDKDSDDPNTHITYLALVPVEKSDEGSDFILRLDLPDSARPIERRTGPILVKVAEENPSDASKNIKQTPTKPSWSTGKTGGKSLGSPEQHLPPKDLQVSPRSRQSFAEQPPNQSEESNTTITPAKRPKENPNTPHNRQLPEIGEITVPELIAGKKATLSCRICNYIPGEHKVSWHVKEKSTGDVIAANYDRKKHESIEKDKDSDDPNTHITYLALVPVEKSDEGSDFILRLDLPDSACPIERRTGPILVKVAEENPSDASKNIKQTPTKPSWSTGKTGGKSLGSPEQHLPPKDLQVSPRSRQSFAEQPPNQREESNTTITPAKRPKENPNTPHNLAEENPSDASKNIKQTPTNPSWSTGKTGGKSLGSPEQHLPPKDLQVSPRSRQSFAEQPPNQREESNTTITPAKRPKENPNTPHNRQLPEIGEITVPELIAGKKATLSCTIYNYIPGEHKVSWHVKLKSTGDVIGANYDGKKHQSIEKDIDSDDTYITYLALVPVEKSDEGSDFILRLDLPDSARPIERRTGPILVEERIRGKKKNKLCESIKEGKDQCTESPTTLAEDNKPQSSDQQQTCKPENETSKESSEEQPKCPVKVEKKDNTDTVLAL